MSITAEHITAITALASAIIGPTIAYFIARQGIRKNSLIDQVKYYDHEMRKSLREFMINIAEVSKSVQRNQPTDESLSKMIAERAFLMSLANTNNKAEDEFIQLIDKLMYIFDGKKEID